MFKVLLNGVYKCHAAGHLNFPKVFHINHPKLFAELMNIQIKLKFFKHTVSL